MNNRVALVCGSSDGLGFGVAEELAKMGLEIILTGRSVEKLNHKLEIIKAISDRDHIAVVTDFNDLEAVQQKINTIIQHKTVQVLINNTGGPAPGKLSHATLDQLSNAFKTHVLASQMISQLVIPGMILSKYGRIINITSTSIRQPIMGLGVSNTIRGAMASWSKTLSLELAPYGITVNNVLPGTTKTGRLDQIVSNRQESQKKTKEEVIQEMLSEIPLGRFAEVKEISKSIAFLASPDASYITGVNLQVDGGKIKSI